MRVAEGALELVYEPEALVLHRQSLGLASFWRQQVTYGRGAFRFRSSRGSSLRLERPGFYGSLALRAAGGGPAVAALVLLAQAATAAGFMREAAALRR